jgi:hypothetical protein
MSAWSFLSELLENVGDGISENDGALLLLDLVVHIVELDLTFALRE